MVPPRVLRLCRTPDPMRRPDADYATAFTPLQLTLLHLPTALEQCCRQHRPCARADAPCGLQPLVGRLFLAACLFACLAAICIGIEAAPPALWTIPDGAGCGAVGPRL